ncbi:uncharacterized protein Z519_00375 [Cladophialophora bantiana CBS 173.52]|uniref:SET domain-containing protein n=1 Tax=Cladophialophora bantiana (strain ATCC 10958 / CBS 173.52 / CDC B-1940 / NIH 8579) TaxID=1442370 RepID=A0A0D2HZ10_CLAB1|nr:uncharacterized protein Z519_00375 [Cladophialophora bantiana CBS 173.52]KIW98713.1 hypothetical protein Z519_00375 [Cladophialophora bantiana CBS 173.52]
MKHNPSQIIALSDSGSDSDQGPPKNNRASTATRPVRKDLNDHGTDEQVDVRHRPMSPSTAAAPFLARLRDLADNPAKRSTARPPQSPSPRPLTKNPLRKSPLNTSSITPIPSPVRERSRTSLTAPFLEERSTSQSKSTVPSKSSTSPTKQRPGVRNADLSTAHQGPQSQILNHKQSPGFAISSSPVVSTPPTARNGQNHGTPSGNAKPLSKTPPNVANSLVCSNCARVHLECDGKTPFCGHCQEQGVARPYRGPPNSTEKSKTPVLKLDMTSPARYTSSETTKKTNLQKEQSSSESDDSSEGEISDSSSPDLDQGPPLRLVFRPQPSQNSDAEQEAPTDQQSQKHGVIEVEKDERLEEGGSVEEDGGAEGSSAMGGEHEDDDCISVSSDSSVESIEEATLRPSVQSVTNILKRIRQQLREYQQANVLADLRQATIDVRKYGGPRLDPSLPDPFKTLTEERRRGWDPDAEQNKDVEVIPAPQKCYHTDSIILPKSKSIGRVNSSFLAPNIRTATHRAYDDEDEDDPDSSIKYEEFELRYKTDFQGMEQQRLCQELIYLWEPWVEELLKRLQIQKSDVLYFFTQDHFEPDRRIEFKCSEASRTAWRTEQQSVCNTCKLADPQSRQSYLGEDFKRLPRPDDRSLVFAGLAARAFHKMTGSSLWHIALGSTIQPRHMDSGAATMQDPGFCLICFRHQCPDHGSYEEPPDDDEGPQTSRAFINDDESDRNVRKFVSLPSAKRDVENKSHICGIFCVESSTNLRQILGRQLNGSISGESRPPENYIRPILADEHLCSSSCFWDVTNRRDITVSEVEFRPFVSESQKMCVEKLMGFYLYNKRGPCLISRVIKEVSCMTIFNHIIFSIFRVKHPPSPCPTATNISPTPGGSSQTARGKKKPAQIIDVSRSADLEKREPFFPCSHEGPCINNPACSCGTSKVHCEWFCGCDESCKRRFRGCTCRAGGNKICFEDNRCECWKVNRECDPHLCGRCGVLEVLDSFNKYRDDIRKGRCRNNRIQLGVPANTTRAPSQVQGYGLYALTDIPSGDFIGEYVGEIISKTEGDRRGALYHLRNQEYLFALNATQEIDASNHGNKTRYMNNSLKEENVNVEPKSLWCNGQARIGLFAKRRVDAGEELLWTYGYSEEHVKNFWEPGEKPASDRALLPYSAERVTRTTGTDKLAKAASNNAREDCSSQSRMLLQQLKRRREDGQSHGARSGADEEAAHSSMQGSRGSPADETTQDPPTEDAEDSDYDARAHVSEDEWDAESDLDGSRKKRTKMQRRRRTSNNGANDKRGRERASNHKHGKRRQNSR